MAHLLERTAKASNEWTQLDLLAYNIVVIPQDFDTFFNPSPEDDLKALQRTSSISSEIWTTESAEKMKNDDNYTLMRLMELVHNHPITGIPSSPSIDFTTHLLRVTGYTTRHNLIRTREQIPFLICRQQRHAMMDVCILDEHNEILLIVLEDKRHYPSSPPGDPEAQAIAASIAVFQYTAELHRTTLGLPPLIEKTVPCIIMRGSSPIFYRVPISAELSRCVEMGEHPRPPRN